VQFLTESKFVIEATVLAHVAAPSYIAARGRPRTPEDLKNHDCIGFTGYVGWPDWPLAKAGKRKTVRPQAQIITDNSEVALDAATAGGGITFTADWLAGPAMRDGKLVEVLPGGGGKGEGEIMPFYRPEIWCQRRRGSSSMRSQDPSKPAGRHERRSASGQKRTYEAERRMSAQGQ
jgi:DNA-binding transcriptional LysR family regulator